MASILIYEPDPSTLRILKAAVVRLGHTPVALGNPAPGWLTGIEVFLVEPRASLGGVLAKAAHICEPALALVSISSGPPPPLDVPFAAALVKPFARERLGATIDLCLARRAEAERQDGQDGGGGRRHAA